MSQRLSAGLVALLVLTSTASIFAHHSTSAEFDLTDKPTAFSGTVTKVEWMNPHVWTYIETKDERGKTVVYGMEGASRSVLECSGWKKDSLKVGQTVSVTGFRSKKPGSPNMWLSTIAPAGGSSVYGVTESCQALNPHFLG